VLDCAQAVPVKFLCGVEEFRLVGFQSKASDFPSATPVNLLKQFVEPASVTSG
jgi:hypothetical protein